MNVFLTGNRGRIGRVLETDLQTAKHEVVGFDRVDGDDILDLVSLESAMQGCDAVIHVAALLGHPDETPSDVMNVNVQGTWNILLAAERHHIKRLVYMSSVNALGIFHGERLPDYLPVDDDHPCYPYTAYGMSKRLSEEMCRLWSEKIGVPVVCLRPPGVWTADTYHKIQAARQERPEYEWEPYWEYGAFIDVRDLSAASIQALTCPFQGFACLLVSAADISTSGRTSEVLATFIHPDVEWRGGEKFQEDPFHSLVLSDNARRFLQWEPKHTWRTFVETGTI